VPRVIHRGPPGWSQFGHKRFAIGRYRPSRLAHEMPEFIDRAGLDGIRRHRAGPPRSEFESHPGHQSQRLSPLKFLGFGTLSESPRAIQMALTELPEV